MTAFLYATDDTAEDALKWVDLQGSAITMEALRASLTNNDGEVDEAGVEWAGAFSRKLYLVLSDTCKGEYRMVESAGNGQGFEVRMILLRRYASKTPGTERALLQALSTMKPEQLLLNLADMFRRYDGMAENQMPEDIRCAILVACWPKDLKEYLDVSSEDFVYSDLRVKANTWIERKRDQQPKNLQQLESKNHQGPTHGDWSGAMGTRRIRRPRISGFTGLSRVSRRKPSILQVAREPTVGGNEFCAPRWKE